MVRHHLTLLCVKGHGKALELADGPVEVDLEREVCVPPGVDHFAHGLEGHKLLRAAGLMKELALLGLKLMINSSRLSILASCWKTTEDYFLN
jgi:hypothetical protein